MKYVMTIKDVLELGKNLILSRWFDDLDKELIVAFGRRAKIMQRKEKSRRHGSQRGQLTPNRMTIDVWAVASENNPAWDKLVGGRFVLELQLAHIISRADIWFTAGPS